MFIRLLLLVTFLFSAQLVSHAVPSIQHVSSRKVPPTTFKRISEYFGGSENKGGKIILRSNPERRGGFYYITTLDSASKHFPDNSSVQFSYIHSSDHKVRTLQFELPSDESSCELWIGLTGDEIEQSPEEIIAWKIEVVDADKAVIADYKSFLWEYPQAD